MEKTFFKDPLFCDFVSFGGFFLCVYFVLDIVSLGFRILCYLLYLLLPEEQFSSVFVL